MFVGYCMSENFILKLKLTRICFPYFGGRPYIVWVIFIWTWFYANFEGYNHYQYHIMTAHSVPVAEIDQLIDVSVRHVLINLILPIVLQQIQQGLKRLKLVTWGRGPKWTEERGKKICRSLMSQAHRQGGWRVEFFRKMVWTAYWG